MKEHPILDPSVQAEILARANMLAHASPTGKQVIEFYLKDGKWSLGNVGIVFPRRHDEDVELRAATSGAWRR